MQVVVSLLRGLASGELVEAVAYSLRRLSIGYLLALVVGLPFGFLLARSELVQELFSPLISAFQSIPSFAWLPLAVLWLGLSESAIILIVFLGAVWSITINTEAGIRNVPPLLLKAGRTMGASGVALFREVALPAALPQILSGLRLAWAFAWRSLMAGELLSPGKGLGEALIVSRNVSDMAGVIAVIVMIGVIGAVVDNLVFKRLEVRTRQKWGLAAA